MTRSNNDLWTVRGSSKTNFVDLWQNCFVFIDLVTASPGLQNDPTGTVHVSIGESFWNVKTQSDRVHRLVHVFPEILYRVHTQTLLAPLQDFCAAYLQILLVQMWTLTPSVGAETPWRMFFFFFTQNAVYCLHPSLTVLKRFPTATLEKHQLFYCKSRRAMDGLHGHAWGALAQLTHSVVWTKLLVALACSQGFVMWKPFFFQHVSASL